MIAGGTAVMSLLILGLGGTIAVELANWNTQPAESIAAPAHRPHAGTVPHAAPPRSDIDARLSEILARPVFSPDRRPIGAAARSVAGLSRLTGIVVTDGRRVAIFAAPAGGRPVVAEEGTHLNAYEVKTISDSSVTVVGPEGTTVMMPIFDSAPPPPSKRPLPALPEAPRPQKTGGTNGRP